MEKKIIYLLKKLISSKLKAKDFEIAATPKWDHFKRLVSRLYKKITRLNGYVYSFSVDYDVISVDGMYDIDKYLRKKKSII